MAGVENKNPSTRAQDVLTHDQVEDALYYADRMPKGATTLRSKYEPKLKLVHPDEVQIGYADEDYPRNN